MNEDYYLSTLKIEKPDFNELLDAIVIARKYTKGKIGDIFIIKSNLEAYSGKDKLLRSDLKRLSDDKIIEPLGNKPFFKTKRRGEYGIMIKCLVRYTEIEKYKDDLLNPGRSGIRVAKNGKIIIKQGDPDIEVFFGPKRYAYLINKLYQNKNMPVKTELIIADSNGLIKNEDDLLKMISYIRSKLKKSIPGFNAKKEFLPPGKNNSYSMKA